MFKFVDAPTFAWWPVTWSSPTEDGDVVKNRIELRFRIVGDAEFAELMTTVPAELDKKAADKAGPELIAARRAARAEFVQQLADGWRGIGDENGSPLSWAPEVIGPVVDLPGLLPAIVSAARECRVGERPNG